MPHIFEAERRFSCGILWVHCDHVDAHADLHVGRSQGFIAHVHAAHVHRAHVHATHGVASARTRAHRTMVHPGHGPRTHSAHRSVRHSSHSHVIDRKSTRLTSSH